jgi:hypothetical protein
MVVVAWQRVDVRVGAGFDPMAAMSGDKRRGEKSAVEDPLQSPAALVAIIAGRNVRST